MIVGDGVVAMPCLRTELTLDDSYGRAGASFGPGAAPRINARWSPANHPCWRLTAPWQGARVTVPALMVVGDRDVVYHFPGGKDAIANLKSSVPRLTRSIVLEGCGHWTQQERPAEVNQALLEFLNAL